VTLSVSQWNTQGLEQSLEEGLHSKAIDADGKSKPVMKRATASKDFVLWCKPRSTDLVEGLVHVRVEGVSHLIKSIMGTESLHLVAQYRIKLSISFFASIVLLDTGLLPLIRIILPLAPITTELMVVEVVF
jgi:hypothetical protein